MRIIGRRRRSLRDEHAATVKHFLNLSSFVPRKSVRYALEQRALCAGTNSSRNQASSMIRHGAAQQILAQQSASRPSLPPSYVV
jgi:hypothetical protein